MKGLNKLNYDHNISSITDYNYICMFKIYQ